MTAQWFRDRADEQNTWGNYQYAQYLYKRAAELDKKMVWQRLP